VNKAKELPFIYIYIYIFFFSFSIEISGGLVRKEQEKAPIPGEAEGYSAWRRRKKAGGRTRGLIKGFKFRSRKCWCREARSPRLILYCKLGGIQRQVFCSASLSCRACYSLARHSHPVVSLLRKSESYHRGLICPPENSPSLAKRKILFSSISRVLLVS